MRQLRLSLVLFWSLLPALLICCVTYASEPAPGGIDLVLVMDVSGSMMRSDPDYHCRQAALSLMEDLAENPASRMAVTAFSDQLVLSSSLISLDTPAGLSAISDCLHAVSYTRGDTDIGLAMQQAAQLLLQESGPDHARCILLLTDGEIDLPKAANEEAAENESLTKVLVAVEDSIDSDIVIHTVMLEADLLSSQLIPLLLLISFTPYLNMSGRRQLPLPLFRILKPKQKQKLRLKKKPKCRQS